MIFQYKGFNFKINFEEKNIVSLIVEIKGLYRKNPVFSLLMNHRIF